MALLGSDLKEWLGRFWRPTFLPAAIVVVVTAMTGIFADREYLRLENASRRTGVAHHLETIKAKLEGNIGANMRLIGGLVAAISANPNMSDAEFQAFAGYLMQQQQTKVRLIAVAPGMINRMVYPPHFRDTVVGFDLSKDPTRLSAALRARDSGAPVLAGPLKQPGSGPGFMARYPVFVSRHNDIQVFWGLVSEIIDVEDLYQSSGLPSAEIDVAITGQDGSGRDGALFYGKPDILRDRPVTAEAKFPGGSWQVYARPKQGWNEFPPGLWLLRISIFVAGLLIVVPTLVSGWLAEVRKRFVQVVQQRNAQLENAQAQIRWDATHDSLTGLPNRRFLTEALTGLNNQAPEERQPIGLLHIDLRRFKQINETLGYAAGDAVILHVAQFLQEGLLEREVVARSAGDEFLLLCIGDRMHQHSWDRCLANRASAIIEGLSRPIDYQGHSCRIGASVGIASETKVDTGANQMLIDADIALNRAKSYSGNVFQFFTSRLQSEVRATRQMANDILVGLERGEFIPHYQPQYDASFSHVIGVEALARWQHPTSGLLMPGVFLPVAEDLNVVVTIDRQILEQTLADAATWHAIGLPVPKASVNVSARRLGDPNLLSALRKQRIPRNTITFELLESIFLDDDDNTMVANVGQIKNLGIDIEIDDFGTGYASLLSLMKLQPNRLKIARPLVLEILTSQEYRDLIRSIVEIGRSLSIEVLAEGVETMRHAEVLRDLGCQAFQGYAFAKPMSEPELRRFLRDRL